jgi:hypothetical protein
MTSLSNWSSEVPSSNSLIRKGDDQFRSEKEVEYNAWEEEHYWDSGSADSGGVHKGGGPLSYVAGNSALSAAGDRARLFYDSDRTALDYVGVDGVVQFGVPARYRLYRQSEVVNVADEIDDPTDRLEPDKVWVMSVRTCTAADRGPGSHFSWFAGAQYGPYDGDPLVLFSTVSHFERGAAWPRSIYEVRMLSMDSSGFTVAGAHWIQGNDTAKSDFGGNETIHVLSLGTMDASRIS